MREGWTERKIKGRRNIETKTRGIRKQRGMN
jgi:hypothetical protein